MMVDSMTPSGRRTAGRLVGFRLLEEGRQAVVVVRAGRALGILTPLDLIEVLNR